MVFCGLCKCNKDANYNWFINELGAESRVSKFRICDNCATLLLRQMTKKVMGLRDEEDSPNPLILSKLGVLQEICLNEEGALDMTIDLDISKARRWVEKATETK